jgi:hypothetical protein
MLVMYKKECITYETVLVTLRHCPFVMLCDYFISRMMFLVTTQIWGKDFPGNMGKHAGWEVLFFVAHKWDIKLTGRNIDLR